MNRTSKILLLATTFAIASLLGLLTFVTRQLSADAIIGLLGVLIGVSIAEVTRHRGAQTERIHELRLAALDRRLETHQQAYALWRRLITNVHKPEKIIEISIECEKWWENNCLYLTEEARNAFAKAYFSANTHPVISFPRGDPKLIEENYNRIIEAGDVIVKGVALPPISEGEASSIEKQKL